MQYKDLNFKVKKDVNTVIINDKEIEVLQYLPVEDKIDLIQITLQKSEENGIYNEMKLEVYFNLNLIYMYTNLEFDITDIEDEFKLYDELESNGVFTSVVEAMADQEYDSLVTYLQLMQENNEQHKLSAVALLQSVIQDLPKNAAAAREIVDSFDPNKYSEVVNFAKNANNGQPI